MPCINFSSFIFSLSPFLSSDIVSFYSINQIIISLPHLSSPRSPQDFHRTEDEAVGVLLLHSMSTANSARVTDIILVPSAATVNRVIG